MSRRWAVVFTFPAALVLALLAICSFPRQVPSTCEPLALDPRWIDGVWEGDAGERFEAWTVVKPLGVATALEGWYRSSGLGLPTGDARWGFGQHRPAIVLNLAPGHFGAIACEEQDVLRLRVTADVEAPFRPGFLSSGTVTLRRVR